MLLAAFLHVLAQDPVLQNAPHPSMLDWIYRDTERRWWVLQPSWLEGERAGLLGLEGQRALRQYLQMELQGNVAALANAEELLALPPLRLRYRLVLEGHDEVLLAGTDVVTLGRPSVFGDVRARAVVGGVSTEVAGGSSIADPSEAWLWSGRSLALELLPVPGLGWAAEVALVDCTASEPEAIRTGNHAVDGLQRLGQRLSEAGATLLLGGAAGPATLRLPGPDGQVLRLELELLAAPLLQAVDIGNQRVVLAAPTLTGTPEGALEAQRAAAAGYAWSAREGWVAFAGAGAADAAARVAALAQEKVRPLELRCTVSLLQARETRRLAELAGSVVRGRPVRAAAGAWTQALTRWDVEIAQEARIANPELEDLFAGCSFVLTPDLGSGGRPYADLELRWSALRLGATQELVLASARTTNDGSGVAQPAEHVLVEQPEQAQIVFQGRYAPGDDAALVLERQVHAFGAEPATLRVELALRLQP